MANPQPDIFVKISTELALAIAKTNFSAYENRVFWCILIKTYGWNKKTDRISQSQFAEVTGIPPRHIWEILDLLLKRQIITMVADGQKKEYGIQKDYELWQNIGRKHSKPAPNGVQVNDGTLLPAAEKPAPIGGKICTNRGVKPAPNGVHTLEESILPKNITKAEDGGSGHKKHFEVYQEELRERFKDLDFNLELEKFNLYWYGGARKLKNPHLALLNWMSKARQITQNNGGNGNGINRQYNQANHTDDTAKLEAWNN